MLKKSACYTCYAWSPQQAQKHIHSALTLKLPDPAKPFIVEVSAFKTGVVSYQVLPVLSQQFGNKPKCHKSAPHAVLSAHSPLLAHDGSSFRFYSTMWTIAPSSPYMYSIDSHGWCSLPADYGQHIKMLICTCKWQSISSSPMSLLPSCSFPWVIFWFLDFVSAP